MPRTSASGISGVAWQTNANLWKVQLHDGEKVRYLGSFPKELLSMAVDLAMESKVTPPSAWDDLADKYRRMKADVTANNLTYKPRSPEAAAAVEATGEYQPEQEGIDEYFEDMGGPAGEVESAAFEPVTSGSIPSDIHLGRLLAAARRADEIVVAKNTVYEDAVNELQRCQKLAEKAWDQYLLALCDSVPPGSGLWSSALGGEVMFRSEEKLVTS
jgi:hypothetical protein